MSFVCCQAGGVQWVFRGFFFFLMKAAENQVSEVVRQKKKVSVVQALKPKQ